MYIDTTFTDFMERFFAYTKLNCQGYELLFECHISGTI